MVKVCALTGAGISKESGLDTFRDADGLWYGHKVEDVATPEGFQRNPQKVLDFYNQRRQSALDAKPNLGHIALAKAENFCDLVIITQNIDDLHEKAGSSAVIHLHGSIFEARSIQFPRPIYPWKSDLNVGDFDENGVQLRPNVVWFGEPVPMMTPALETAQEADVILVIGTSLQVYPAAGIATCNPSAKLILVDPKPPPEIHHSVHVIAEPASVGVSIAFDFIKSLS